MAVLLGIDTGGTFTDAVLVRDPATDGPEILASAKSPTTHDDLATGIAASVAAVLDRAPSVDASEIALVALSTTLATNALVEGHGEPAGLIAAGFDQSDLERAGVSSVVDADRLIAVDGGHDAHGNERLPLDEAAVVAAAEQLGPTVSAFAVISQFSVRNPGHERRIAELLREHTGRPVTTSHVLSARLDGPRRALTAALNARLLGTIALLHEAAAAVLADAGISAPLMVVRGDGSLVSVDFAAERPIETVLSGPAASVVGALHLADLTDGLVADIGGTTTDIAVIRNGRPTIAEDGAVVGGHRTMVEAVDMATTGLGGDSEVRVDTRHDDGPLLVGPARAIPIGRLALVHPGVLDELRRQLAAPVGQTTHGRFLVASSRSDHATLDEREQRIMARLASGPLPESVAAPSALDARAAARLRSRRLVRVACFTPSDAVELVDGGLSLDVEASTLAAELMARQSSPSGAPIAANGEQLSTWVIDLLVRRSSAFALRVALATDGIAVSASDPLIAAALDHHRGAADVGITLAEPIAAIGAPASTYYPAIAERLRTPHVVPRHAEVANAVGAVVGKVHIRRSCTITQPTKGQFRVHLDDQPAFGSVERARQHAREVLEHLAVSDAERAGAARPEVSERWSEKTAVVEGKQVFVEGTLTVEATGRPRF